MYSDVKKFATQKGIIGFTVPHLHRGKDWYVDYQCYDPATDKMRRRKVMLNKYPMKYREDMGGILIHNLFEQLKLGWNPFINGRKTRQFTPFDKVLERYRQYVDVSERKGILKPKTATDYRSRLHQLVLYIEDTGAKIGLVYQFDRAFAIDFLDYLIYDKDNSATTRNNYRTWLSTFGSWLVDRQYMEENPIESIHNLRESEKVRNALSVDALAQVGAYTSKNNPHFQLACMMEYYTLIRPDELRNIRIGDISIKEQTVFVSAEIAKNRKGQAVALNDAVLKLMIDLHVFDHANHEYLFGEDMRPGERQLYVNRFRLEWVKLRKALHFPDSYQFYSLKDAGIRDLANAVGIVVARDQARHSDVAVTNRYLKSEHTAHEATKHYKGKL